LDQDFCIDGLSEEQVHCLDVYVKANLKGQAWSGGCLLGKGKLLLTASDSLESDSTCC
jgi:hypothetical protein